MNIDKFIVCITLHSNLLFPIASYTERGAAQVNNGQYKKKRGTSLLNLPEVQPEEA